MSRSIAKRLSGSKVNNPGPFLLINSTLRNLPGPPPLSVCPTTTGRRKEQTEMSRPHDGSAGGRLRERQLWPGPPARSPPTRGCVAHAQLTAHTGVRVHTHKPVSVDLWEGQRYDGSKGPRPSWNVTPRRSHTRLLGRKRGGIRMLLVRLFLFRRHFLTTSVGGRSCEVTCRALVLMANPRNDEHAHSWQAGEMSDTVSTQWSTRDPGAMRSVRTGSRRFSRRSVSRKRNAATRRLRTEIRPEMCH